jgi:hypothetical protein
MARTLTEAPMTARVDVLTGERGHYELAAGRDPLPYLEGDGNGEPRRHVAREGLGYRSGPERAPDARAAEGLRDSAHPGACGIYQTVDFAPARIPDRPAAHRLAARPRAPSDRSACLLVAARASIDSMLVGQWLPIALAPPDRRALGQRAWRETADEPNQ